MFQVILLIYEYAIAVESSLVQSIRRANRKLNTTNITNDTPFADRLDRSYFGFDQDYYERMPLLVNAMQENSYVDPTIDITHEQRGNYLKPPKLIPTLKTTHKTAHVRRTSPRPFIFEYKSPTPVPFSKTYRSKSWIESYRNAQRLKNIQQVIKYLEKTINAKIGDMYTLPSSKQIAFTGLYLEPSVLQDKSHESEQDLAVDSSNKVGFVQSNHQSDPLFRYKPDNPGEVNLLADGFLRFSPNPNFGGRTELTNIPMFRPIPSNKRTCHGYGCETRKITDSIPIPSSTEKSYDESSNFSQAKTFSVMLNLFPLKPHSREETKKMDTNKTPLDQIYLTTSKPLILFKRKSTNLSRRRTIPPKRPRILKEHKMLHEIENNINSREKINESAAGSNMIVQINLYTPNEKTETTSTTEINNNMKELVTSSTESNIMNFIPSRTTEVPFLLSTSQVEDYHVGSSGIIPVEARAPPPPPPVFPQATTLSPFFDVTLSNTEAAWFTKPPDILKFSHEDAKIPEEYRKYRESDVSDNIFSDINRRNFRGSFEMGDFESRTLVTKLKNEHERFETTTSALRGESTTEPTTTTQINGHYRSVNQKPNILSTLLDPNSEMNRKRRLNLYAKGFRRANFSRDYVEIQRNSTSVENIDN